MRQLDLASKYFSVPPWRLVLGSDVSATTPTIVKTLSGEQVSDQSALYTTRVDGRVLDKSYLWLTQQAIDKRFDITIVYVDGSIFAFRYMKSATSMDWRENIADMIPEDWEPFAIPRDFRRSIKDFMLECNLLYGRLDFVSDVERIYFLEVNPNGQWAWLDLQDANGLLSAVVRAIDKPLK